MSRRVFAKITETGICDENGRESFTSGWRGKVIAREDWPVSDLIANLMARTQNALGWSGPEAAQRDIDDAILLLKKMRENIETENP